MVKFRVCCACAVGAVPSTAAHTSSPHRPSLLNMSSLRSPRLPGSNGQIAEAMPWEGFRLRASGLRRPKVFRSQRRRMFWPYSRSPNQERLLVRDVSREPWRPDRNCLVWWSVRPLSSAIGVEHADDIEHLVVQGAVGGDQVASHGVERCSVHAGNTAAGLGGDERSCRHVPRLQVVFPESFESAGRDVAEVECRRSRGA